MQYYSLNNQSPIVSFSQATIQGQAPDKGLYFPSAIPQLPAGFVDSLKTLSKEEIGFTVMKPYVGGEIPDAVLQQIVAETINFDFPLVQIDEQISTLELFHGPTLAFKDVGARFMSRCLGYFSRNNNAKVTVLVATSGDTGGAVANGFLGVEGVEVVILYPSGKVSPVQEMQLTRLGQNIHALEINGTFDDCQAMVKNAFVDNELTSKVNLTSANSINVARWLPQQLYYFYAFQQWQQQEAPVVCVPSGNFGNICAGILAHVSGLPVKQFIAACNANDVVPSYLKTGVYQSKEAIATISNAMDVGNPSNFVRIMQLFSNSYPQLLEKLTAYSISDAITSLTIREVYNDFNYLLDPHGAVAYYALHNYLQTHEGDKGFFLETAHPVKFPDVVEKETGTKLAIPDQVQYLVEQPKQSILMEAKYEDLKEWLINKG
ncbi:MAG: threonine synthase [Bacteroidota bacterium]